MSVSDSAVPANSFVSSGRFLIVNADDFGQTASITEGIAQAFEEGIVTSASLMVRFPAAVAAARYARAHPRLSVGLHFDLGEWIYRDGEWTALYHVIEENDAASVADEVQRQLGTFRQLVGRDPTHFDSHQHVHRYDPTRSILREISQRCGVPLRDHSSICYNGSFYGQGENGAPYPEGVTIERFMHTLSELSVGITELGCHPGQSADVDSMYRAERVEELKTLCDPIVREWILREGITLRSFHDLPGAFG